MGLVASPIMFGINILIIINNSLTTCPFSCLLTFILMLKSYQVVVHLDYNVSSGSFLTMNFEFDQDHGPWPGPKLVNIRKRESEVVVISYQADHFTIWTPVKNVEFSLCLVHFTELGRQLHQGLFPISIASSDWDSD